MNETRKQTRLDLADIARIDEFKPLWIRCNKCSHLGYLLPERRKKGGDCKCLACGAIYRLYFDSNYPELYARLPLWLKKNFRRHIFWAANGEHLDLLERVIRAELRTRPMIQLGKVPERFKTNRKMPFNLPQWMLSAKNRPDLLRLINRMRRTIPKSAVSSKREQSLDQYAPTWIV